MLQNFFNLTSIPGSHNNKDIKFFCRSCRKVAISLLCLFTGLVLVTGCAAKSERTFAQKRGELSVVIDGFRNDEGEAIISLFMQKDGFPDDMEKAWQSLEVDIESGCAQALFPDLPYGEYALSILHDEDGDKQMKSSWLGKPREGFGFSGQPDYNFGPPTFADSAFLLVAADREIMVRVKYDTMRQKRQNEGRAAQNGKHK